MKLLSQKNYNWRLATGTNEDDGISGSFVFLM